MAIVLIESFFLETPLGKRFCVYHSVENAKTAHRAILLVPPFAEEINKSRHMLSTLARTLASHGYAVLLVDLDGCGDSHGELRDSSWESWRQDLAAVYKYLRQRTHLPISLLGLRLGALLALDFLKIDKYPIDQLVLWQPAINGRQLLNQFLRLRLASDMLSGKQDMTSSTQTIRKALLAGEVIEIGGYELPPQLAAAIDAQKIADYLPLEFRVDWLELQPTAGVEISPAKKQVIDTWAQQKVEVRLIQIPGAEFWASQEIENNPELIASTVQVFLQGDR
ncbi:hydrolase 2, exosortase A system-associated [Undibacterium sp.]|uniref:hydrolase 2, exosortase A system-associated n=1 Tax=Undibacterium sp. TaxID=1914977 RepID=UPI0025F93103|nr:hydrolase 2, exosortase A system-associated [Undibacterium sp.]